MATRRTPRHGPPPRLGVPRVVPVSRSVSLLPEPCRPAACRDGPPPASRYAVAPVTQSAVRCGRGAGAPASSTSGPRLASVRRDVGKPPTLPTPSWSRSRPLWSVPLPNVLETTLPSPRTMTGWSPRLAVTGRPPDLSRPRKPDPPTKTSGETRDTAAPTAVTSTLRRARCVLPGRRKPPVLG